ncbi:leptin receptor [Pseudoliparis swirei]|uniref:leptin receptor n=1 Tax=Pseudoliparis swirei TaxID=2059687 RepID=UPI0024BEFD0C|nr:leptin receptor [Pseudoliparis swirei]
MLWPSVWTVLMLVLLLSRGARCVEPEEEEEEEEEEGPSALDLPWQDELCCDSPAAHLTNRSEPDLPQDPVCSFRGSTSQSGPHESSGVHTGACLDILCTIDGHREHLRCDLRPLLPPSSPVHAGPVAVSLRRLSSRRDAAEAKDGTAAPRDPVVCHGKDAFACSLAVGSAARFVAVVTVSISAALAPPVLLRIPQRPVRPSPPVHLSHLQTLQAELVLHWDDPPGSVGPLRYEVRHAPSAARPAWQVASSPAASMLSLDLKPRLNYTVQVRCSGPDEPPGWSGWSAPHHIYLNAVSYIPEKVVARPGDNVTVHCVFNDRGVNASAAVWRLNFQRLQRGLYHPVSQRVSRVTVRPSEARLYDLLQCTEEWAGPYSQVYVDGASIDINCVTNGDIDAMDCSWKNTQLTNPKFRSRWADLPCDVMEARERAGEEVGEVGPACPQVQSKRGSCSIRPLRMNCYRLWLEVPSRLGPVRTKPTYLTPIDHVKPHTPTNVRAVSRSGGVLEVSWEPPPLPAEGLQCQIGYRSPSAGRAQPEWKTQSPVRVSWTEVSVSSDMCRVYAAQVRCMHTNGTGYWSEWSDAVYSAPQNSRAPERGPDFWRVIQDEPYGNQTNVTLLFEQLRIPARSYCVDGFIVRRRTSTGSVTRQQMDVASSFSFQWDQEPHTVTVEAFNDLGSSAHNVNMTLERRPRRRVVRSFGVSVVNSTCVSLSWSLLDDVSAVPLFMVVQWSLVPGHHEGRTGATWTRLPYTDSPVHLRGDFFGSEQSGFSLYPVFADGEAEPMYATATRRDPAASLMLLAISFLFLVLFVTLILSQNQMKKFVWKEVPDPNKCSWARGLDFNKTDTFDHLLHLPECPAAWQLLLPPENISKVAVVDKIDLSALTSASVRADPRRPPGSNLEVNREAREGERLRGRAPSSPRRDRLQRDGPPADLKDGSAPSSVAYATVLLSDPKQQHLHLHLHNKSGSGSSSGDEGNFSADNSDISDSSHGGGGLWAPDDPRRSRSYTSVEELSEGEEEEEEEARGEKDVSYLEMEYPAEDSEVDDEAQTGDEEEEETSAEPPGDVGADGEGRSAESSPLLGDGESSERASSPLYLPQFRTTRRQTALAQTGFK